MVDAFSQIRIRGMELGNRFMRSATHDTSADESGAVTDKSISIYKRLGEGDIGLIVSGYTFVSAQGQAFQGQYGAHTDEMLPSLRRMVEAVHSGGGKIALQIVHAGRAGLNAPYLRDKGIVSLAPSKLKGSKFPHREMTTDEIEAIIKDFGAAAARAREAGFDAVQLHGAHGYLLSQFLSPLTNKRTDIWGGSPENRRRFHIEVVREVRRWVGGDFPLLIKLGIMDDAPGGTTLSQGIDAAREMTAVGVDAVEVSFGIGGDFMQRVVGKEAAPDNERPWFRERAAALKAAVSVPVGLVGGIRSFNMAQTILNAGEADIISMCRPFIREPKLISRWLAGDRRPARCITCGKCYNLLVGRQDVLDSYCWQEFRSKGTSGIPGIL
jgi:2,4-dienoyl-CoA reductase-like NADH-dependent reductase (Old Yellow Enzyme family)